MHLLYTDETNLDPKNDFFVYGGLAVDGDQAHNLSERIRSIRARAGVDRTHILKFNPGPANLGHPEFIDLKRGVIEAAVECGCVLMASLVLHRIAPTPETARRYEINRVLYHFDCLMHRLDSTGVVLLDRFNDKQIDEQIRERFSVGVKGLPYSPEMRLERILGYSYSAIGFSHFASLIDIVLGSLRFAVNEFSHKGEQASPTAGVLLRQLEPLFHRNQDGARVSVVSLNFSPNQVKVPQYLDLYTRLGAFLADHGIATDQASQEP